MRQKNSHKNILESGLGVEIKRNYILPWTNQAMIRPYKRIGIFRGVQNVHKKPQVLVFDLGISANQQGQGFHWVREVRESWNLLENKEKSGEKIFIHANFQ